MPQIFYFAGIACLALALVLSLFASISVPSIKGLDFARFGIDNSGQQVQMGIWGVCIYGGGPTECQHLGSGYLYDFGSDGILGRSWTRGLAIHPFVTILVACALGLASFKHEKGPILATLASLFAAFFAIIAFVIDIAFYAKVNHLAHILFAQNDLAGHTQPGGAFWMSFVSLILIFFGGCMTWLEHRKNRAADGDSYAMESKPGFLGRFR
ncbi:hypothetical protein B0H19DRAFT_1260555 [Mycena capillaripes]|nr:hypothetical protein B0H19DRAFT_1260555 [Mycena capillaripes]